MTDFKKYTKFLGMTAAGTVLVCVLARPDVASEQAREAVAFCLTALIPSLFVSMVLSGYLMPRVINALRGRHTALAALVGGILCGFPSGADIAARLRKSGAPREYCDYINSFANNAGISFVISFVGAGVLKSARLGAALLVLETVSAVICMIIMKWVIRPDCTCPLPRQKELTLTGALKNSLSGMASVCGAIVLFSCVAAVLPASISDGSLLYVIIKGLLEFSGGINAAGELAPNTAFVLAALFVGWSGLCVMLQVKAVGGDAVRLKYYVLSKVIQAALMTGGALVMAAYWG